MPTTELYKQIVQMNTPDLFNWLREAKKLRGLTNKQIADATGVPLGTVDRVMSGKYTEVKRSTLQPITSYLAKLHEETLPPDTPEQAELNTNALEGLKMVVQLRDAELEALTKSYKVLEDRVEFLKGENKRKDRWVTILATLTIVLFTGIIALLVYDLTHPDVGWYQTAAQWFASMGVRI